VKRVLALVGAIAMVAGALVLRSVLDGDGGGRTSDDPVTIACVRELRTACEAIAAEEGVEVRIEDFPVTAAALTGSDPAGTVDIDAWVAPGPIAAGVNEQLALAGRDPVLGEPSEVLARSPLVLVGWTERLTPLREHCGGTLSWTCIGESADVAWSELGGSGAWGALKPGHARPDLAIDGLLVMSQAAADRLGTTDYASNDFADPAFRTWFEQLEQTVADLQSGGSTPLDRMLSQGVAAYDVVGTTEAQAVPAVARSRDRDRLEVLRLDPQATADVVVTPVLGAEGAERAERTMRSATAAEALAATGWRVPGQTLAEGLDAQATLPDDDGAPAPGVLLALLTLWQEVT
jgi:hypothetical protein